MLSILYDNIIVLIAIVTATHRGANARSIATASNALLFADTPMFQEITL